jgi:hypothetical protein
LNRKTHFPSKKSVKISLRNGILCIIPSLETVHSIWIIGWWPRMVDILSNIYDGWTRYNLRPGNHFTEAPRWAPKCSGEHL